MRRSHGVAIAAILAASAAFSVAMAGRIPERAPIHWNLEGAIDGYGPKWIPIAVVPAFGALFTALLAALPRIGPLEKNFERSSPAYGRLVVGVCLLFAVLGALVQLAAAGVVVVLGRPLFFAAGAFVAWVGNSLGKLRRNHWVGIKTPWTLESDAVWERTHRAGGKLMVAVGALVALSTLFAPEWVGFALLVGGLLALVVWSFVYSRRAHGRLSDPGDGPRPREVPK